ncbi:MAG: 3-deoxy-7-phosphoheptulonate synthase [Lentisphaeria bacterium]
MSSAILSNLNIEQKSILSSPQQIYNEFPLTDSSRNNVALGRKMFQDILDGNDKRLVMIVGPCSIHNPDEAIEYAKRLKNLADQVSDKILLVMRVYFEKPRTTVGWKGLIYDPDINKSYDFEKGLRKARKLLLDIAEMGLPTATEMLDPIIAQYIADLVSWAAIGARTTESQTHRQMVSGLSMPVGFKNATNGDLQVAIDAIQSASAKHAFIGVLEDGKSGIFHTKGNKYTHIVLRGGNNEPNYGSEWIAYTREKLIKSHIKPNIIVDLSHANSRKDPMKQPAVMDDLLKQIQNGEQSITGIMVESNLESGAQKIVIGEPLKPGVSITDGCLGWNETESMIRKVHAAL